MFDTTKMFHLACGLFSRRTLVLLIIGVSVFSVYWPIEPSVRAQTIPPLPTPTATPPSPGPHLVVTKRDFLYVDADNDSLVSAGDRLFYVITVLNDGLSTAPPLRLHDSPDPHTNLIPGSVRVIGGVVTQGNQPGDTQVLVEIAPLRSGTNAIVSLQVLVNSPETVAQLNNQARVSILNSEGQPSGEPILVSDDPDTAEVNDATVTPLEQAGVPLSTVVFLPLIRFEGNPMQ